MKMKTMLMVAMGCLLGQVVCGSVVLSNTQDADIRSGDFADTNMGVNGGLWITYGGEGNNKGNKSYHLFDATGMAEVTRVESITVYWFRTAARIIDFHFIDPVDGLDTWKEGTGGDSTTDTEGGITWNNAPGNYQSDPAYNSHLFAAYEGETVLRLGGMTTPNTNGSAVTLAIEEGSANEAALLYALNNQDRKVTIGINYHSTTQAGTIGARERDGTGEWAAKMTVVPEPATLVLLGLGSLSLLRKRK